MKERRGPIFTHIDSPFLYLALTRLHPHVFNPLSILSSPPSLPLFLCFPVKVNFFKLGGRKRTQPVPGEKERDRENSKEQKNIRSLEKSMRVAHWRGALVNSRAHWTRPSRGCGLKISSRCVIAYIDHTLASSRASATSVHCTVM